MCISGKPGTLEQTENSPYESSTCRVPALRNKPENSGTQEQTTTGNVSSGALLPKKVAPTHTNHKQPRKIARPYPQGYGTIYPLKNEAVVAAKQRFQNPISNLTQQNNPGRTQLDRSRNQPNPPLGVPMTR